MTTIKTAPNVKKNTPTKDQPFSGKTTSRFTTTRSSGKILIKKVPANRRESLHTKLAKTLSPGIAWNDFVATRNDLNLSSKAMADMLLVSGSTLKRRKSAGRLEQAESERLYRIYIIIDKVRELLGQEQADRWLNTPNIALGGREPFQTIRHEPGTTQVDQLLDTITVGNYS